MSTIFLSSLSVHVHLYIKIRKQTTQCILSNVDVLNVIGAFQKENDPSRDTLIWKETLISKWPLIWKGVLISKRA